MFGTNYSFIMRKTAQFCDFIHNSEHIAANIRKIKKVDNIQNRPHYLDVIIDLVREGKGR